MENQNEILKTDVLLFDEEGIRCRRHICRAVIAAGRENR